MRKELNSLKVPSGLKDNPARYCKDMLTCNKFNEDGKQKKFLTLFPIFIAKFLFS